jgi:hypothetical protein
MAKLMSISIDVTAAIIVSDKRILAAKDHPENT